MGVSQGYGITYSTSQHRTELSVDGGRALILRKRSLGEFLARNPFEAPYTLGFFYREKMRAIHCVAPDVPVAEALELGGGRSGLTRLLYPGACVTNLDIDPSLAQAPCNQQPGVKFVVGDATNLQFDDGRFDLVSMFDLLEHINDDERAISEALRVLKPMGVLLVSTPHASWRYPYFRMLSPYCPTEQELFKEWGHVRRGYSLNDLIQLIDAPLEKYAFFISPVTALSHDIAFAKIPRNVKRTLCALISPVIWTAYWLHDPKTKGTETASAWRKLKQ